MKKKPTLLKRTFTSINKHGFRDFYKIIKLRVNHAFEVNPDFANYYSLPNSEAVLKSSYLFENKEEKIDEKSFSSESYKYSIYAPKFTRQVLFQDQTVVIFSGVPFDDVGGGQRPAQFARVLLKQGKNVIFVYAYKKYDFALGTYISSKVDIPNLEHIYLDDITPDELVIKFKAKTSVLFELPHKKFLLFANLFWSIGVTTIFDLIDEWDTSLGGDWYSTEVMQSFVTNCSIVCGSAKMLKDKLVHMGREDALYIPNAANEQIFDLYKAYNQIPQDYQDNNKPRCLYFGSLYGEWFGWEYLFAAASKNLDVDFYLIGDYSNQKVLPKNIFSLGSKTIEELPAYLYHADAALLPFIPGKISDAVSPIKIFEYLFMGKPVVATSLPEIVSYPNVFIGEDPNEFAELIKVAIERNDNDLDKIEEFIFTNSWAFRLQNLLPSSRKLTVSVVILMRNNERIIRRCLHSLIVNGVNYIKEIIVVDNDSSDNSYTIVKDEFPKVILLQNNKNGCSSGRNLGIKKATGKYIAFFDSDQWLTSEGCFEESINILNNYPYIGAVGWAAGWIDQSNEHYGGMIMDYLPHRGMLDNTYFRTDIAYLGTGGFFIKKETLDKTNLFDEFYDPTAFEDTDLSFQLKNLGFKLAYRDFSGIKHQPHQTTNASSRSEEYTKLFKRNADYFKNKWVSKSHLFDEFKGY